MRKQREEMMKSNVSIFKKKCDLHFFIKYSFDQCCLIIYFPCKEPLTLLKTEHNQRRLHARMQRASEMSVWASGDAITCCQLRQIPAGSSYWLMWETSVGLPVRCYSSMFSLFTTPPPRRHQIQESSRMNSSVWSREEGSGTFRTLKKDCLLFGRGGFT